MDNKRPASSHSGKPDPEKFGHIGEKIRHLRQERGISLTDLANRAGIAKSYLSNIERKVQSNPSMLFLEKISRVFDIEVENLMKEFPEAGGELDPQWAALVHAAIEAGVGKDEFKAFIDFKKFTNWSGSHPGSPGAG